MAPPLYCRIDFDGAVPRTYSVTLHQDGTFATEEVPYKNKLASSIYTNLLICLYVYIYI